VTTETTFRIVFLALLAALLTANWIFVGLAALTIAWLTWRVPSAEQNRPDRQRHRPAPAGVAGWRTLPTLGYFDRSGPRLGAAGLIRFIPPLARATYILRYRLEGPAAP
jgi:hypothetical protein